MNLAARWSALLEGLHAEGRHRELSVAHGVDLASNDYLGYAQDCRCVGQKSPSELPRSGMASRLLRGHHVIWDEVETALAQWHGTEGVLMMTSGYAANEGLLSTIIEADDWVASDALNHASIIDGLRLSRAERFIHRHLDLNHLEAGLRVVSATRSGRRQLFVVTES